MNSHEPDEYKIEPASGNAPGDASARPAPKPENQASPKPAPIELEEDAASAHAPSRDEPPPRHVKDLDVCPNCGASMRGTDALVCLRCGFDLKTMRVMKTETGEAVEPEGETDAEPLVKAGMGNVWLPGSIAAVCGGLLVICYLAGVLGLFPAIEAAILEQRHTQEITIGERFTALLQFIVLVGMWTACGLGALAFLAKLLSVPLVARLGDVQLAAVRMLAIVLAARMATLINLPSSVLEWIVEATLQLGIFIGLSIVLFRLNPRDGATLGSSALILFMLLWGAANAVVWATGA